MYVALTDTEASRVAHDHNKSSETLAHTCQDRVRYVRKLREKQPDLTAAQISEYLGTLQAKVALYMLKQYAIIKIF